MWDTLALSVSMIKIFVSSAHDWELDQTRGILSFHYSTPGRCILPTVTYPYHHLPHHTKAPTLAAVPSFTVLTTCVVMSLNTGHNEQLRYLSISNPSSFS